MIEEKDISKEEFSLTRSGVMFILLQKLGLAKPTKRGFLTRCLVMTAMTWVPLFVLSALQGLAFGNRVNISFFEDFATHTRFLIILPLLIFAEASVDKRLREQTRQFFRSGILDESDLPAYKGILAKTKRILDAKLADLAILGFIVANLVFRWYKVIAGVSYWAVLPEQTPSTPSWAGYWYIFFSVPVLQFIMLRWLWRWIVWVIFFRKVARLPLKLNPAHPDGAGGLGFLGLPPTPFLSVSFAFSVLFSAVLAEQIAFLHQNLKDFYIVIGVFAAVIITLNVIPLLVFMKPMAKTRRKGILEYGAMIQEHHREFDRKWMKRTPGEDLLGMPDASSMADLNSSFDSVMKMNIVPFNLRIMLFSLVIVILPMLPLFAFEYDLATILKKLLGLLF